MFPFSIPFFIMFTSEIALTLIAALISAVVGLSIYAFTSLKSTVERIETKIDAYEEKNSQDHAAVDASLARLEEGVRSINKDLDRHEKRIDELFDRDV